MTAAIRSVDEMMKNGEEEEVEVNKTELLIKKRHGLGTMPSVDVSILPRLQHRRQSTLRPWAAAGVEVLDVARMPISLPG